MNGNKYYKFDADNNKVYAGIIIEHNGVQIINPSESQLIAAGYQKEVPDFNDILNEKRQKKINEILEYDSSDAVNSFTVNGISSWLDRNTRVALRASIEVKEAAGGEKYTVWLNNTPLELDTFFIKSFIDGLELYATECFNVTQRHIKSVSELEDIYEIENYDFTTGYPEKININL